MSRRALVKLIHSFSGHFFASYLPAVSVRSVVVIDLEVSCEQVYSACVAQFLNNQPNTYVSKEHVFISVMSLTLILNVLASYAYLVN